MPGQPTRILYAAPDLSVPSGGVKVLYQHVELLRAAGYDAHVMHTAPGFRCDWFRHDAPIVSAETVRQGDLVIVPETWPDLAESLAGRGIRYCLFVQNGYYVLPSQPDLVRLHACYRRATAILSISEDTTDLLRNLFPDCADKILRVKFPLDPELFYPEEKTRAVTFMPRKSELHAMNVVQWLKMKHPDWRFQALLNLREAEVAEQLRRSRIFLAFSDFEGGPLPPLEAALAGNLVVGYHGWGGREYWDAPNFIDVPFGDVRAFVARFGEACRILEQPGAAQGLAPGIDHIKQNYGKPEVTRLLVDSLAFIASRLAAYPG